MVQRRKLKGAPRFSIDGVISNSGIDKLCDEINQDGDGHPDDILATIRRINSSLTDNLAGIAPVPQSPSETAFLCLAFGRYLNAGGRLSLDKAFGVVRARVGRPAVPVAEQQKIALEVWARYLSSAETFTSVLMRVGEQFAKEKTQIRQYFYEHFLASYVRHVHYRDPEIPWKPLTTHELERVEKLRKMNDKWAVQRDRGGVRGCPQ